MKQRRTYALMVDYLGGDYQMGIVHGAEEVIARKDQNLVIAVGRWLDAPKTIDLIQNDVFHHLGHPGTDAILFAGGCLSHFVSPERLQQIYSSYAPLPVVSISVRSKGFPSIVVDNRRAQRQIVDHMIEVHGAKRIAYLRGPRAAIEANERLDGYKEALASHGLDFDPTLVFEGNFWVDSGKSAVLRLQDSKTKYDAIVAANDYMALGAMDGLKSLGLRIPDDVRIAGFDDVPAARMASPSLTTVRQPLNRMGALAIELLEQMLDSKNVEELHNLDVELVRRQSCGCGHTTRLNNLPNNGYSNPKISVVGLESLEVELKSQILSGITIYSELWPGIVERLISALIQEYSGASGVFLATLYSQLDQHQSRIEIMEQFNIIISVLRAEFLRSFSESIFIEDLCHSALLMIGEWVSRVQMRALYDQDVAAVQIRSSIERLSTVLNNTALSETLEVVLPTTKIRSACLSLYDNGATERLRTFSIVGTPFANALRGSAFDTVALAPEGFFSENHRQSFILMPLSHGENLYGQALFEMGDQLSVYTMLREQIGALLKAAELHRTVVEETARRERAERERLERETEIAQQIQTAILPDRMDVSGLEISAVMRPATTVGGDYYDVIPVDGGCYIGIGDVTGHGLLAGMIMIMVQSMITATVRIDPYQPPSKILPSINEALYDNIRSRLHGTDHVTLTLIRYYDDGRLLLSGAHEDALIWRKKSGKCERISPPGFWLGAVADVRTMTYDLESRLEDGDQLVLYTDGVTESMNGSHEQFELSRLIVVVERHGHEAPKQLCGAILQALSDWSSTQIDDVSLLIVRYKNKDGL